MPDTTIDGLGTILTRADLDRLGVPYPAPPELLCEFCGAPMEVRAVRLFKAVVWIPFGECPCEGASLRRERERRRAEEEAVEARYRRYRNAGIEKRYFDAAVDNRASAEFLSSFPENGGNGLYICGVTGAGKTHMASAIACALVDSGRSVIMSTSIGILSRIKATFDAGGGTEEAIREYGHCDLLVIDDLGKESASDWSLSTMFQIVNMRYGAMLPTVVTSQYRYSKLVERLERNGDSDGAEAIVSRIKQTSRYVELERRNRRLP